MDGRERGVIIHLLLECLTNNPTERNSAYWLGFIGQQLHLHVNELVWKSCWQEVQDVFNAVENADIFNPENNTQALNEVPLIYRRNNTLVHGIIDRLIIAADSVLIIDYKSHQHANRENLHSLAVPYQEQLRYYIDGVKQLWADKIGRASCRERV